MADSCVMTEVEVESSAPNNVIFNAATTQWLNKVLVYDIGHIIGTDTTIRLTKSVLQKFAHTNSNSYKRKRTCSVPGNVETRKISVVEEPLRKDDGAIAEPRRSQSGRIINRKRIISPDVITQDKRNISDKKTNLNSRQIRTIGTKSKSVQLVLESSEASEKYQPKVQDVVPEEGKVVEGVAEERHPFLLFRDGPQLVAGRLYISALEGHTMSIWRYDGLTQEE